MTRIAFLREERLDRPIDVIVRRNGRPILRMSIGEKRYYTQRDRNQK